MDGSGAGCRPTFKRSSSATWPSTWRGSASTRNASIASSSPGSPSAGSSSTGPTWPASAAGWATPSTGAGRPNWGRPRGGSSKPRSARSFDRERVDRRADGAGERQRRRHEEELEDAVPRAVFGQLVEREDLADQHAHVGDEDLVHGLVAVGNLVGPHLHAPRVGGDGGATTPRAILWMPFFLAPSLLTRLAS